MNAAIQTERLLLRRWRPEDLAPFAAMNADPRVMEFFPAALDAGQSAAMVEGVERGFRERGFGLWAAELKATSEFIGFIGLSVPGDPLPFAPCVEIGWRLAHAHWGRGYATEGARAALAYGFGPLGLDEIVSFTAQANARSRGVMTKIGMTRDPKDDFLHPRLPESHPLAPHVLYRKRRGGSDRAPALPG